MDIRKGSDTFLQWYGEKLTADDMRLLYVPEGFAHGFQSLESDCVVIYFVTQPYSQTSEGILRYNDPRIGIKWPIEVTNISEKDKRCPLLNKDFPGLEI